MKKIIGEFEIGVEGGGHPVWCELRQAGTTNSIRFPHSHLDDLRYAVKQMKKAARADIPDNYKHEVGE